MYLPHNYNYIYFNICTPNCVLLGWGIPTGIVLICVALEYENYGGKHHCWLQMDTK